MIGPYVSSVFHRRLMKLYREMTGHNRKGAVALFTRDQFIAKGIKAMKVGICLYCGDVLTVENISPDHVHPLSKGGTWELDNIEFVCLDCNIEKTHKTLDVYLATNPSSRIGQRYTAKRKARKEKRDVT